jgi:uncharacterized membrane protein
MQRLNELPTLCIGVGLLVLVAGQFWSSVPVVTAVALVGVGACAYAAGRWTERPLAVIAHMMLYIGITVLFAGSRIHAMSTGDADWRMVDALDFYLAGGLAALACLSTMRTVDVRRA